MVALFIIGVHFRLGFYSGSTLILPSYISVLAGTVLCLLYLREMLEKLFPALVPVALLLIALAVISVSSGAGPQDALGGTGQLLVSITLMGVLILSMHKQSVHRLHKAMLLLWFLFAAVTLAEIIAFRDVFESVIDWLYSGSGRGIYDASERDLLRYGIVRPRALASEPSILAFTLFALATLCYTLKSQSNQRQAWLQFGAMVAVSYLLSPSLTIVFWVLAVLVWHFWPRSHAQTALVTIAMLVGIAIAIAFLSFTELGQSIIDRIEGVASQSGSLFGRLIVGPPVTFDALMFRPLFGFGVGNEMGVAPIIEHHWQISGAFARSPWFLMLGPSDQLSNGFYWMWIELGIAGGLVFTYLICRFMRAIGVVYPLRAVICGLIIWYSGGAFVDAPSWFAIALFAFVPYPGSDTAKGPRPRERPSRRRRA